jgi:hypothetical protein
MDRLETRFVQFFVFEHRHIGTAIHLHRFILPLLPDSLLIQVGWPSFHFRR